VRGAGHGATKSSTTTHAKSAAAVVGHSGHAGALIYAAGTVTAGHASGGHGHWRGLRISRRIAAPRLAWWLRTIVIRSRFAARAGRVGWGLESWSIGWRWRVVGSFAFGRLCKRGSRHCEKCCEDTRLEKSHDLSPSDRLMVAITFHLKALVRELAAG